MLENVCKLSETPDFYLELLNYFSYFIFVIS